jgi:hypothetical protein
MKIQLCRHIKTNGLRCKSPAFNSGSHCYFHATLNRRHSPYRYTPATRGYLLPGQHIELAPLEDRESVQLALSLVINALASGNLDTRRATALLYGLQLAGTNAAHVNHHPCVGDLARSAEPDLEGLQLAEPRTAYLPAPGTQTDDPYAFTESDEEEDEDSQEEDDDDDEEEEKGDA